jgi:hypothetical protein
VLLACERAGWGCPPWEVAQGKSPAWWFERWQLLSRYRAVFSEEGAGYDDDDE